MSSTEGSVGCGAHGKASRPEPEGACPSLTGPSPVVLAEAPRGTSSSLAPPRGSWHTHAAAPVERRPTLPPLPVGNTALPRGLARSMLAALAVGLFSALLPSAAVAAEPCPNASVLIEDAGFLGFQPEAAAPPECRGYELVSPPYKEGFRITGIQAISADGSRMVVSSPGAFAGTESDPENNLQVGLVGALYEFTRESSGWVATGLDPSPARFPSNQFFEGSNAAVGFGVSGDLSKTLWYLHEPEPSGSYALYLGQAGGSFLRIGPTVPPSVSGEAQTSGMAVEGVSRDLSDVVFSLQAEAGSQSLLWPGDTTVRSDNHYSLYQYVGTGNAQPQLVGVDTANALISDCGTWLGGAGTGETSNRDSYNAVSADGEVVFFTPNKEEAACHGPAVDELYARVAGSETVAISEPSAAQCSNCNIATRQPAEFQGASEDGSKVFFTTSQQLLPGTGGLYEYDFGNPAGEKIVPVAAGAPGHETSEPRVVGVVRVSEDGSHVYFVAGAKLTGENAEGREPQEGGDNLYVFERDASYPQGRTAFVATLSNGDGEDWGTNNRPASRTFAQASPDGRFLVFTSQADLTPDDTSTVNQLFEYDAQQERLVRVSVGHRGPGGFECPVTKTVQEGFNCDGNTEKQADAPALPTGLAVSSDGADVFFQSADGLAPGALNNQVIYEREGVQSYARDVYEYHSAVASGVSITDGNVVLISDGKDLTVYASGESGTQLYGTDASGADVFFSSGVPLVGQDTDTQLEVYDARVDGGFPQPVAPASCSGEGCLPVPAGAPTFGTPLSASIAPGANLTQTAGPLPKPPSKPKSMTRVQKLAKALKACKKKRHREQRAACQAHARKLYGPRPKAKKTANGGS